MHLFVSGQESTFKLLKKQENFWILKLKILYAVGLNQKLNNIYKLLHCHLLLKAFYTYLLYWQ